MKRKLCVLISILMLMAMAGSALAMPIHIDGGRLVAKGKNVLDDVETEVRSSDFQLLGVDEAGEYLLYADGQMAAVPKADVQDVLDALGDDADLLPSLEDYADIARGAKSDAVREMQEALIRLDYLEGEADGDFGGGSAKAVSAFQQDMGLQATGRADALTQMLILSSAQETFEIVPAESAAASFEPIMGKTAMDLSGAIDRGLRLKYDDIAGTGEISNGNSVVYEASAVSDIDRCTITARVVLDVAAGEDGAVAVRPVVKLQCLCVRRPVMTELMLKSGDRRVTLSVEGLDSALEGVESLESGTVFLNTNAVALIAGAPEAGELKLRIVGKYGSFDVEADEKMIQQMAEVAGAAE